MNKALEVLSLLEDHGEMEQGEQEQDSEQDTTNTQKVKAYFVGLSSAPSDDDVHALASKFEMEPSELERIIYELLFNAVKGGGVMLKAGELPDEDFDPDQLAAGLEEETEHTDNPELAKQIVKGHLVKTPNYYLDKEGGSRLKKLEKDAESEQEKRS